MALSNLSIVIPVYNEQERISASLDTILEYLANSDFHCEILIGDDGSDDNTVDVVNKYVDKQNESIIKNIIILINEEYLISLWLNCIIIVFLPFGATKPLNKPLISIISILWLVICQLG